MQNEDHLSLCPIHSCGNYYDYSLATIIKEFAPEINHSQFLTSTGFYGVTTAFDAKRNIPDKHAYLVQPAIKDINTVEEAATLLLQALENYFIAHWQPRESHVVLASAGADSRIILYTLRNLSKTQDLGEFNIICTEPEGPLFRKTMRQMAWPESCYDVWKEGRLNDDDYFRIGNFDTNVNAFNAPLMEYWTKGIEPSSTLVMGLCGGEMLDYPVGKRAAGFPTDNRFEDLLFMYKPYQLDLCQIYATWKRVLLPYLNYEYLDAAFRIDESCFYRGKHAEQPCDAIRAKMLELLGDTTPCYTGHIYNWNYGAEQADYIRKKWHESKLYNDFKHLPFVRSAEPWTSSGVEQRKRWDVKLYGLATAYERAFSTHAKVVHSAE